MTRYPRSRNTCTARSCNGSTAALGSLRSRCEERWQVYPGDASTGIAIQGMISMDGKGRALDNIFVERLWRTVKYEEVYLKEYDSPRAARQGLSSYLQFYNEERLHQSLGYRTPAAVYWGRTRAVPCC